MSKLINFTTGQSDIALEQSVAYGSTENEPNNSHWGMVGAVSWRKWLGIKRWTDFDWWAGTSRLRSQHKERLGTGGRRKKKRLVCLGNRNNFHLLEPISQKYQLIEDKV